MKSGTSSLQAKVIKRYSMGLDFTYAFTYSKEPDSGRGSAVSDVFNRRINKTLSNPSRPLVGVIAAVQGQLFPIIERMAISLGIEFSNILNRTQINDPSSTAGFGFINPATVAGTPRNRTAVMRFSKETV